MKRSLIVLDRDGVVNEDRDDFVKSLAEWQPIRGSLEAMSRLYKHGWTIAIATNQSGIGRGLLAPATLDAMHAYLQQQLARLDAKVDLIVHCPHIPSEHCRCRKPSPGLLEQLCSYYQLSSLAGVPCVGDSLRDLEAASAVNGTPILVETGKGRRTRASGGLPVGTLCYENLAAVSTALLAAPQRRA